MTESDKRKQADTAERGATQAEGLTRRQWILRLGEAAVLAGFSGAAAEALTNTQLPTASATTGSAGLPPGLYESSGEHMAHVLFRDSRFIAPPPGSETEYAVAHAATGFEPAFFSRDEFKIARRLVELVLNSQADAASGSGIAPVENDTVDEITEWIDLALSQSAATREAATNLSSQHRELAVHYYGGEAVRRLETADLEKGWKEGLAWLQEESNTRGQNFLGLSEAQQIQLLDSISTLKGNAGAEGPAGNFGRLLKASTIQGYYTSRAGLKELDYKGNAFYPESPGCPNK